MLVLTRRDGEGLLIGEDIVIHMIRSADGQSRIAIDAPRNVNIVRLELLRKEQRPPAPGTRK